jgi:hypothetical protein
VSSTDPCAASSERLGTCQSSLKMSSSKDKTIERTSNDAARTADNDSRNLASPTAASQWKGLFARMIGAVPRFLFMKDELAAAAQRTWHPGQPGFAEFKLARSALETARNMADVPARALGAVLLLSLAARFAARAVTLRRGLFQHSDDLVLIWKKATEEPDIASRLEKITQVSLARVEKFVFCDLTIEQANVSPSELVAVRLSLTRVVGRLVELLEREATVQLRLRNERVARWSVIAVVGLALICWNSRHTFRSMMLPNLALHKAVKLSSNWRPGMYPPLGLVDGETAELGCHTDYEDHPWAQVDLGQPMTIRRVVVTNRVDGDMSRAVPLIIETSLDGTTFAPYARQDSDFAVWTAKRRPTRAQHVRVTAPRFTMLHLNEIEVY